MRPLSCLVAITLVVFLAEPVRADGPNATAVAPPPAPSDLQVSSRSAFEIALQWKGAADGIAGFEVQQQCADGHFVRVSMRNPDDLAFSHHARTPATQYTYRVRAFTRAGFSAPSPLVSVRTPPLAAPTPDESFTPPPCTSFDMIGQSTQVWRVTLVGGRVLDIVERQGSRANGTASWTVYGTIGECYRQLGTLEMYWPQYNLLGAIVPAAPAAPVLVVQTGESPALRANLVALHQITNEGVVRVDDYLQCESSYASPPDPDSLPTDASRFPNCQYADACERFRRY